MPDPTEPDLAGLALQHLSERRSGREINHRASQSARSVLLSFCRSVPADLAPGQVETRHVADFLTSKDITVKTWLHYDSVLRSWFGWMLGRGLIDRHPMTGLRRPRKPRTTPRGLPAEAVRRLLDHVRDDPRTRLMVTLMLQEGLRCCEVSGLQLDQVDFEERTMLIIGKGDHERLLPATDETWAVLTAYLPVRGPGAGALVANERRAGTGLTPGQVSRIVSGQMRDAGVAGTPHCLRHTAASDVLRRGASLRDVQQLLGHASLETTQLYLPLVVHDLRKAMNGRSYGAPISTSVEPLLSDQTAPARTLPPSEEALPVSHFADAYVDERLTAGRFVKATGINARCDLRAFAAAVGDVAPGQVTRAQVERWLGQNHNPATRRRLLSRLKDFYRWMVADGHVPGADDPTVSVGKVRVPRSLPRGLRPDQVAAVLAAAPDLKARLILHLEAELGFRCVEVTRLTVEDIDDVDRTVRVYGKAGHQRNLPVPPSTWTVLAEYRAAHPVTGGPVFRSEQYPERAITANHLSRLVAKWMRGAGVPGTAHQLRHSFAGALIRGGVDLPTVQHLMGHDNLATTSRYLVFEDPERLRTAVNQTQPSPEGPLAGLTGLDMIGPLIDAVAALTATVARLEAKVEAASPAPLSPYGDTPATAPPPPVELAACTVPGCGYQNRPYWVGEHARGHCPECGEWHKKVGGHRTAKHGIKTGPAPSSCPFKVAHDHNPGGACICPHCGQSNVWVPGFTDRDPPGRMAAHHARPHDPCPDCDRAYIDLASHRRRAHPWASRANPLP